MKTKLNLLAHNTLAAFALAAALLSTHAARAEFEIQELMSRYNQAETLALVKTARGIGIAVDPAGYRESVRGATFVASLPILNGNTATREQWARGRDVALLVVQPTSSKAETPAGLYVVRVQIARGVAKTALVRIDDSGNPISIPTTFTSPTQAECEDPIQHGEDFVCLHFCFCEYYGGGITCGSFPICFTI